MKNMDNIIDLMKKCPLKQDIRERLWEVYIRKLGIKPMKYLTLYCPPLMDVKHFCSKGHINLEKGVYEGVVGITNVSQRGYRDTISEGVGRLELLKEGVLHNLLEKREKDLIEKFPFDVINLDYCNHIYGSHNNQYISGNLQDIVAIIKQQDRKEQREFVLFVTTRTDKSRSGGIDFPDDFKKGLLERIRLNIHQNIDFKKRCSQIFGGKSLFDYAKENFNTFISIGIIKLFSMCLAEKNYGIKDCDVFWLIRTKGGIRRKFLHIALLVSRGKPQKCSGQTRYLRRTGAAKYMEKGATIVLDKVINHNIIFLTEETDGERLQKEHGEYMKSLEKNFELPISEPISNE